MLKDADLGCQTRVNLGLLKPHEFITPKNVTVNLISTDSALQYVVVLRRVKETKLSELELIRSLCC